MKKALIYLFTILTTFAFAQTGGYQVAVLKYSGGGDYYANPTSLPNLVKFCNKELNTNISLEVPFVEVGSKEIYLYPFLHMTGHGNVVFSPAEVQNLRTYLQSGGFLHIDDNYGMDTYIRTEIKKLFPQNELIELPATHELFKQKFTFPKGLPKIHEHDGKRAQAFAIIEKGKIVLLYTYETDLGDGWEDTKVHGNSVEKHQEALRMGANILMYAISH